MFVRWLNYHHLLYFWTVAREGSIARACQQLLVSQPTVSGQLRALENAVGRKLFERRGRKLVMSDTGQAVFRYAEDIFTLGRDLEDMLRDRPTGRPLRLNVGVSDALPKLTVYRLLEPALKLGEPLHLVCQEGKPDVLLAHLALHEFDVVLSDQPASSVVPVKAFSHLLGECGVSFFAAPALAATYRRRFPQSLDGAPVLLPASNTALRRSLDAWFDGQNVRPVLRGEFDDSALMNIFGQSGGGVFPGPTVIEKETAREFGVRVVGRTQEVRERFFAITVERKLRHPAVAAISEAARRA